MKKWVKNRHKIITFLFRGPIRLIFRLKYGLKIHKTNLKKDENVFVISNHQTDLDPIIVGSSFNKTIYFVATDSIFSNDIVRTLLVYLFNPIPKRKGISDPKCVKTMLQVAKENGSICLFVEGNRSYAEFQYYVNLGIAKLIKACKLPLILYNIHGGFGCLPRFGSKKRKGKFYGGVKTRIEPSEYNKMSNQELVDVIMQNIKVYDSDSNENYKSNERAECLERMLFVCPKCKESQTLVSNKAIIKCNNCGLEVEYTLNLRLKSNDKEFHFDRLIDWYNYQKEWIKEKEFKENEIIFEDDNIDVFLCEAYKKRKVVCKKAKIILTTKKIILNNSFEIDLKNVIGASPISGTKLSLSLLNDNYLFKGHKRFNPLKYALVLHKLDTYMKEKNLDPYYALD